MAFLFSNLYFFLMLGYILYIICRFSKSPSSIDDNKKKEVDIYKIDKIYMISSICFVICAFFIINPFLTIYWYQYVRYVSIFFGIFNAVMTVLYIKYRDDIYFYESYNLIFTVLITFIAISSDYKGMGYYFYKHFADEDTKASEFLDENKHRTFIITPENNEPYRKGGHTITTRKNKSSKFDKPLYQNQLNRRDSSRNDVGSEVFYPENLRQNVEAFSRRTSRTVGKSDLETIDSLNDTSLQNVSSHSLKEFDNPEKLEQNYEQLLTSNRGSSRNVPEPQKADAFHQIQQKAFQKASELTKTLT